MKRSCTIGHRNTKHSHLYTYTFGINNLGIIWNYIYILIIIYLRYILSIGYVVMTPVLLSVCSEFGVYQQYCYGSLKYRTFAKLHRVALGEFCFWFDC